MTRLRLTFTKQGALRYIGHLDMAKTWERILRRAGLPVAYSQGYHPQPKIQFASALPVGCASVAEVMDVILAEPLTPDAALRAITPQLPDGIQVRSIEDVPLKAPTLQATLQSADYTLTIKTPEPIETIGQRIQTLLDSPTLLRERRGKTYDLRPLILDLRIQKVSSECITIWTRLRASQESGTGRPDELLDTLGLSETPTEICRTALNFALHPMLC